MSEVTKIITGKTCFATTSSFNIYNILTYVKNLHLDAYYKSLFYNLSSSVHGKNNIMTKFPLKIPPSEAATSLLDRNHFILLFYGTS